jgi:RNA polymerase primary sigma factor
MRTRRLISYYIYDLEELYENNKSDNTVLNDILFELSFRRQRKRVCKLKNEIIKTIDSGSADVFEYVLYPEGAAITNFKGRFSHVRIPEQIEGHKVVGIEEYAFIENHEINSIEMPDSILWIDKYAFQYCKSLKKIHLSNRLVTIGEFAFSKCVNLLEVTIPESVVEIGEYCFDECQNLSLTIPYKWIPDEFINKYDEDAEYEIAESYEINGSDEIEDTDEIDFNDFDFEDDFEPSDDQLDLYNWQKEAIEAWSDNGYIGIVEAVTGAGKTHIAMQAVIDHLYNEYKVVIIVPTITLMNQWFEKIESVLYEHGYGYCKIERMGDGHGWTDDCDVLIAVCNSASRYSLIKSGQKGLLIADECHRYGAEQWSASLEKGFQHRLGLTATLERQDEGIDDYIIPYFEKVVYRLEYEQALEEKIIAKFKIAFLGVDFDEDEREKYDEIDGECRRLRNKLINSHGIPQTPYNRFMSEVVSMSGGSFKDPGTTLARKYIQQIAERKKLVATSQGKFEAIETIVDAIENSERTIIFTQTIDAAKQACEVLTDNLVDASVIDSSMNRLEREEVLENFSEGELKCIISPKILDEGVDVPEADLAIIVSSSKTKRQMIQRVGRVIRKKVDGRLARIVILYIKDTMEDPHSDLNYASGDTFVEMIQDVAFEVVHFDLGDEEIIDYLNDYWGLPF